WILISFIYFGCGSNKNSEGVFIIDEYKYPTISSAEILLNDSILIGNVLNIKYRDSIFILNYELLKDYKFVKYRFCYNQSMITTFRILATYDTLNINKDRDTILLTPCEVDTIQKGILLKSKM